MRLRLEFQSGDILVAESAEMNDGDVVVFGPIKLGVSVDGGPVEEISGNLHISEEQAMVSPAEVSASPLTLNVQHGEDPS